MKATPVRKTLNKRFSLIDSERRYKRACKQVNLLNSKISDLLSRIAKPASTPYQCSLKYGLGLRLCVVQALRDLYNEYANSKAQTVADLRAELFGENVNIITDDMSDSESDGDYWTFFQRIHLGLSRLFLEPCKIFEKIPPSHVYPDQFTCNKYLLLGYYKIEFQQNKIKFKTLQMTGKRNKVWKITTPEIRTPLVVRPPPFFLSYCACPRLITLLHVNRHTWN